VGESVPVATCTTDRERAIYETWRRCGSVSTCSESVSFRCSIAEIDYTTYSAVESSDLAEELSSDAECDKDLSEDEDDEVKYPVRPNTVTGPPGGLVNSKVQTKGFDIGDGPSRTVPAARMNGYVQSSRSYALLTAAYNEEAHIGQTIESLLSQSVLPVRWVLASDGSTDKTSEIIQSYADKHDFIRLLRVERKPGRSFRSKVVALRAAQELLKGAEYDFVGNIDADITVGRTYFEDLLVRFERDPSLGIAGGFVCERTGAEFHERSANREYSVAHAAQIVRRECYEEFGGYAVLEYGGEDWHAQISARMKGWRAVAFPELQIFHHRHTGTADNLLRHRFRQGKMDYAFGSDPVFEVLKCLRRLPEAPLIAGGIARLFGFALSGLRREARPVSDEFVSFLRRDQRRALLSFWPDRLRPRGDRGGRAGEESVQQLQLRRSELLSLAQQVRRDGERALEEAAGRVDARERRDA
jgi:poly-beta-1,6-N-acetyl-D-glucosamine synthase